MLYLILAFLLSSAFAEEEYNCSAEYKQLNIPYVESSSVDEMYYCFGYFHGKDRAWEMDYFRRVAQGRNAEIHGFSQLKSDLMMRLLDLPSMAEKVWNSFAEEKRSWLKSYTKGVNRGFETGKESKEFKDKDYLPEAWLPEHSLQILLLQSFDQTRKTFFRDYEEEKLKGKWGEMAASLFDEDDLPWENTILKDGEYTKKENIVKTTSYEFKPVELWGEFPTLFGYESGSNNWVVSAKKSKTGKALLANDPHLDLKTPMFWYWISLKTPEHKMIGASVPGVPVIASGTNGKVAWGLTNSYLNSADVAIIKNLKDDQVESFRPTVYVKFFGLKLPFFFKSFEKLKTGHRILPLDLDRDDKLVLRWTGFSLTPQDFYPMLDIFRANSVKEMDRLTSEIGVPSWNFVFADTKGDIGYRLVGKTFKHEEKIPYGISSMTFDEFTNEEYLDPSQQPHVLKPSRQYVYSANNRHWPSDSKFYGGRGYSQSYRGLRIDELLKNSKHNMESFSNIQCDRQVVDARFFLQQIQKYLQLDAFKNWSMVSEDSSTTLPIYRRLMDLMMEKWNVNETALYRLLDKLDRNKIQQLKSLHKLAVEEVGGRTWGELHRVEFPHMSKNKDWKFSPDIPGIGDTHSVDPGTSKWNSDKKIYEQYSGASMRMIIEMDKTPKVWLTLPGLNRNYDQASDKNPWEDWKSCRYTQLRF